ncbi:MAG TPA: pitrilysin family protein [Terriglobales bacterium]|nr:pitrilysin family protein [Terriglobales bacterium]
MRSWHLQRALVLGLMAASFISQAPGQAVAPAQAPAARQAPAGAPVAPQISKGEAELDRIKVPPLPAFHPEEPQRIQLANGLVIFLQPDHELPLITGIARIRGGARSVPADKTGMMDIYGEVWRTGGTKARTGDQLDDYLEARAAKIETDATGDSTVISFNCLKADLDNVFAAFLELLREPAFRNDNLEIAKQQMYAIIARRNDDSGSIAQRESMKLAYGKDNPYARVPEYSTVAAVRRDDLLAWHSHYLQPGNIILGVVGDFDPKAMEAKLRQSFESWPKGAVAEKPAMDFTSAKAGYYFIDKEDVNQSSVHMVALGIRRDNPDYYAIQVMNEILGGGFSSRLFQVIRSKLALAYTVGGGVGASWDHPGVEQFSLGTKSATTAQAIRAVNEQLEGMLTGPPTTEEMKQAKDSILNSFIFNFDSREKVLVERMRYEFYGYPADFLERYRAGIEKVTVDDVMRVARKHIHPDQLAVLVVGNSGELGDQLKSLGQVTTIDITIPPPPGMPAGQPAAPGK